MRVRTPIGRGFIALLLAAGSVLATAQPASAASVTGTAQLNGVAASITRGTTDAAQVVVSATESAIFDLDVTGPGVTVTFGAICTLSPGYSGGSPVSKCSVTAAGVVTIGNDGDATPNETQTATVDITVATTATSFTSTEGSNVGGQAVTITASGTATSPTTGTLTNSTANTTINPNPAAEAEIRVTTAAASPTTVERGPTAKTTYSATFARVGNTSQPTAVDVQLLTGAAQGTSVSNKTVSNDVTPDACTFVASGSNCAKITFPNGGTSITVTFDVSVPATAGVSPPDVSYAFKGTYDPTGTDGAPLDVENGTAKSFTVLTDSAPDTTIDTGPGSTTDGIADFTFSSAEPGATFECELTGPGQGAGFTTCTSPKTYSSLADGEYTFSVRAKDGIGNADPSPATNTFTVDNTAPTTTIDSGPGSRNDGTAEYTFSSNESGSTFECELTGPDQNPGFSACSSPQEYTSLADGEYTFSVKATDTANNTGSADTDTFTMDGTAPVTTIDSGPGSRNDGTAEYTFSSNESGSTFECELTGPDQSPGLSACSSPQEYTSLADGEYTFSVKATDTAGNTGTADTDTFTMDGTAPVTTIESGPGSRNDGTAEYTFSSDESGSTFECELTGPGQSSGFSTCESPKEYTGLADGEYTFSVKATDTAGNTGSADTDTFTMDGTAPVTTIDSGPGSRNDGTAEYTFSSNESGSTFECKLDGPGIFVTGTFAACTSPQSYPGLADGEYTFSVKATDAAGNTGTADTDTFTMDGTAPVTTIDSGPGSRNDGTAEYTFSSDESGSTFECELTGPDQSPGFSACSSPQEYTSLADGEYTFSVKATDAAGNTGTADTDTFAMDGTAPTTTIESGPGSRNDGTAEYTFSSDESGSTFECTLDGPGATTGTPEACDTGSKTYTGLTDGEYTFSVKATDTANNTGTADTDTFTMDGTAPTTTIDSGPGSTADGSAEYTFSSNETGSTFECTLDGPGATTGTPEACDTGSKTYTLLTDGEYTFSVKATDTIGNTGAADTDTFAVDGTAPDTLIDSGPGNTDDGIADFTFSASELGATFECKLDGPGATTGTFAACNTGSKSYSGLTDGSYTFSVQATDASNNNDETPATQAFTVAVVVPPTSTCAGFAVTIEGDDTSETLQGTPGDDVIAAKGGNDIVLGGGGNDVICGGTGNDQLYGEDGNDGLAGEAGNDSLTGGTGADDLSGGDGTSDRASYYDHTWAVNATIGNAARDDGNSSDGPSGDRDRVYGTVEGLVGGPGGDSLTGTAVANTLDGVGGNDTIQGLSGNDTLLGGSGNDKVVGGTGKDSVYGGTGADTLYGQGDSDFLHAKDNTRDARIDGGTGTDTAYRDTIDPAPISVP